MHGKAITLGRRTALAALCCLALSDTCRSEEPFTGETAAYIDWTVKTCDVKSSEKTRGLVEQAKAKADDAFTRQYMKGFASKELAEANADRVLSEKMCAKLNEWYGRSGSRIAGLINKAADPPTGSSTKKDPASGDPKGGRRRRSQ